MPQIIVKQPFKFAHRGIDVEEFEASAEPRETTDECADIAVREGWADLCTAQSTEIEAGKPEAEKPEAATSARKARGAAPENKSGSPESAASA